VKELKGRVAVVTGAASGIGFALAERFAMEGMNVVMADVEVRALESAAEVLRPKASALIAIPIDVAKSDDVERLARETYARFGAAHVLCNNAGVGVIGAVHEHSLADWQWVINVNLWGVIHGVRAFVPRMLASGQEAHIEHLVHRRPYDRGVHVGLRCNKTRRDGAVGINVQGVRDGGGTDRRLCSVPRPNQDEHHAGGTQPAF